MKLFKNTRPIFIVLISTLAACASGKGTGETSTRAANQAETTPVTDENYALAETQIIIEGYVKKVAAATNTNGVGVFMHNKKGADPKDRTIMRINFDTLYSFAVVDLKKDLTLTMPATHGRYQTAWIISEEHYNPGAFDTPGAHKITQEWVGTRYAVIVMRTQVNTQDPTDLAKANSLQEKLQLTQKDRGSYVPSHKWDMDEVLKMRAKYMKIGATLSTDEMFGKRGEICIEKSQCRNRIRLGWVHPSASRVSAIFSEKHRASDVDTERRSRPSVLVDHSLRRRGLSADRHLRHQQRICRSRRGRLCHHQLWRR